MNQFLQQLPDQLAIGITQGAIYALIALGYTMVYGILELINFAHGEIFMIGSYIAVGMLALLGVNGTLTGASLIVVLVVIFVASMLGSGILGITIERFAYRPLRNAPRLAPLISAVGVSILLQNLVLLIAGARPKDIKPFFPERYYSLLGTRVSLLQIIIVLFAVFLMIVLNLFIRRTKLGAAMRAVAQDKKAASLMGIDVNTIIAITFLIGSALGAAAGVMALMYYGFVTYTSGYLAGIKAFTAAVLGGIGNVPGAMLGGFLIGIVESLAAGFPGIGSQWKDVIAFLILIIVLIFKPSGLLGEHVPEKV